MRVDGYNELHGHAGLKGSFLWCATLWLHDSEAIWYQINISITSTTKSFLPLSFHILSCFNIPCYSQHHPSTHNVSLSHTTCFTTIHINIELLLDSRHSCGLLPWICLTIYFANASGSYARMIPYCILPNCGVQYCHVVSCKALPGIYKSWWQMIAQYLPVHF